MQRKAPTIVLISSNPSYPYYELSTTDTINQHKGELEATYCAVQFRHLYANPKPSAPSVMAISSFSFSSSALLYAGKSNCMGKNQMQIIVVTKHNGMALAVNEKVCTWLKQVCAEGSRPASPYALWIEKRCVPRIPCRLANPPSGT